MRSVRLIVGFGLLCSLWSVSTAQAAEGTVAATFQPPITRITIEPATITLDGAGSLVTPLITGEGAPDQIVDLTSLATLESLSPTIFTVDAHGRLRGLDDGTGKLRIAVAGKVQEVPIVVKNMRVPRQFHFDNDILPILSKFSCNMSGCHGKAEGQNGFKLSVFGFDPRADHQALTQESRGRRINPVVPGASLLLTKASGGIPHGGGVRIAKTSEEYRTLYDWIVAGMPYGSNETPRVVAVRVTPQERTLTMRGVQQLRVTARYSNGVEVDVTHHARYQSNNEAVAKVDELGFVTAGDVPGDVAIMAAYLGEVDIFRALVPRSEPLTAQAGPPVLNFIDGHIDSKLKKLRIEASPICSDADFVRRVYLDLIGTLPTASEARDFLANQDPDRRMKLVDTLFLRPEFADYWALKWSDWLRVDRQALGHDGAYRYYKWIHDSFAKNLGLDQFAKELVSGQGLLSEHPAGHFFKVVKDPGEMSSTLSQSLLGIRIDCAKCHHHPFDRWSQDDYYGMQAYFTGVKFKPTPRGEMLLASAGGESQNPRSGLKIYAHPLGTSNPEAAPKGDPRLSFASWLVAADNPFFARNIVNRAWAHLLGRGIVEPLDDVRLTNPPSHPELLTALSKDFIDHKFDFRYLLKTIIASRTYQLSAAVTPTNTNDEQNFSRSVLRRLDAEVLLDAICQTTKIPEKFDGVPAGSRAIQLWDSLVPHYFLGIFGRPVRSTPCDCERAGAPNVSQVLHVLNSPEIQAKLTHEAGFLAELARRPGLTDKQLIDELYLTFFSRYPSDQERTNATQYLQTQAANRQSAIEDLAWSMLNSLEFVFNH
ncbi:MAG: hypothetical protein JWN70_2081 [Planctomycetaceae bacterium]|nr:hypothetical protein [Planctomycetaceae bacterium]